MSSYSQNMARRYEKMRRKSCGLVLALACAVILLALPLSATQIVISNAGFDSPVVCSGPTPCTEHSLQAFGTTQTWWSGQNGTDFGGWVVGNTSATADAGVWAPVAAFTPKNEELFLFPLSG